MQNEDYFEYIKKKPFEERLRAFGYACESTVRNSFEGSRNGIGEENAKYYRSEAHAQMKRADFLFRNLIEDYESKGGNVNDNTRND